jgi:hypothetical protein
MSGSNFVNHGTTRKHTANLVSLKTVAPTMEGDEGWFAQVHAIFMILAWLASAGTGMLLARYYKETWRSVRPMGKDLWFRFVLHLRIWGP